MDSEPLAALSEGGGLWLSAGAGAVAAGAGVSGVAGVSAALTKPGTRTLALPPGATVIGVVHVKSIYGLAPDQRATTTVDTIMGPVLAVPEARDLDELFDDFRRSGTYLAVVVEGELAAGDRVEIVSRDPHGVTVADLVAAEEGDSSDRRLLERAIAVPALPESWKRHLRSRLK